jgi:hypothetical protein
MAGRIVGADMWMPRHELPKDEPYVREVRDDFARTTSDQFLAGGGGFWEVTFRPHYATPNPWGNVERGSLDATLEKTIAAALERAGLRDVARVSRFDVTQSVHFPRPYCRIEVDPKSGRTDEDVYRAFSSAWPHDQLAIPLVVVAMQMLGTKSPGELESGHRETPLKRLFEVGTDCFVNVRAENLTADERARLKKWAAAVSPGSQKQPPARLLLALLSSSTDLSTSKGRETLQTLKDLRFFSEFWSKGMDILAARFKPNQLSDCAFLYNGHATFAMTSLLPTLNAFAPGATNLWVSKQSGTPSAREIIRIQKPTQMFAEAKFTRGLEDGMKVRSKTIADLLDVRMRMPQGEWGTQNMIVDKIGPWLSSLGGILPGQVVRGEVRAIVHNRDDFDALKGIERFVWGVDFASSEIKAMEARFIGEQFALMGAREIRAKGWGRAADVPLVINGFGLLGEQLGHALLRLGMDPKNVTVVDPDPGAQERARALGFSTTLERKPRALVINASPGLGIGGHNLDKFGEDLIVMSMTSGGKGIDFKALCATANSMSEVPVKRRSQQAIKDVDLVFDRTNTRARIIAEGLPPNLVDEMWGDRYQLTSMGVSAAALQAAELTKPGIAAFDPKLDRDLIDAAKRAGLFDLRALDARPGENARDLLADLRSFTAIP